MIGVRACELKKISPTATENPRQRTSREVSSNQSGPHQHLQSTVRKHLNTAWRKPVNHFSEAVFAEVSSWLTADERPFILDSGCGTGESSVALARQFPESKVLGFDRSAVRLDKLLRKASIPDNCLTLRADAEDLWRQLLTSDLRPVRHFLFYPNPYPKAAHLNRRWHGSPVFPFLVELGGKLELRSNWPIYVEEFALAVELATGIRAAVERFQPETAISPFETKYLNSGHSLWRLTADLPGKAG